MSCGLAYPAISSYWLGKSRKDLAERAIATRREQEAHRFNQLKSTAQYYRDLETRSAFYQSLENPRPSTSHWWKEEYARKRNLKEEKKEKLQERRARLAALLKSENEKLQEEMKQKQKEARMNDPWKMDDIKQKLEDIRKKREEEHKKASQKDDVFPSWIQKPRIKQLDAKVLQQEVLRAWQEQLKQEDMKELRRIEEEEKQHTARLEQQKQETERELMVLSMRKKEEEEKVASEIDLQKKEVKNEIKQSEKLKVDEAQLYKQLTMINDTLAKRKEDKQARERRELSIALMRLPKDKLRRKSFEIQQELEFDKGILDMLLNQVISGHTEEDISKIKSDLLQGQKTIENQMKIQKDKQSEIQILYQEEARRLWRMFESNWNEQKEIRDGLMSKILDELRAYLQEKLAQNLKWQEESLTKRGSLLQSLEELNDRGKEKVEQSLIQKKKCEENLKSLESAITSRSPLTMPSKPLPWPW